ncbi:hypothetical protein D3C80_1926250 [compost metagenome]
MVRSGSATMCDSSAVVLASCRSADLAHSSIDAPIVSSMSWTVMRDVRNGVKMIIRVALGFDA